MIDEYPIEIQIKTKEQYVAHEATHDPVYKSPTESSEEVRQEISDKLFPYFETYAHMMFHFDSMSEREVDNWKYDEDNKNFNGEITLTEEGSYVVTLDYEDRAGNKMETYTSELIIIDKTPVEIGFEYNDKDVVLNEND